MALSNDDIQQLIAILQKGLSDEAAPKKKKNANKSKNIDHDEEDNNDDHNPIMKTKSVKIKGNTKNKFLSMGVKDLHKEDIEIDKMLNKSPPTPRTRRFKPVNVVCRSCGKKESVSPSLLHDTADRYKCNNCSGSAG